MIMADIITSQAVFHRSGNSSLAIVPGTMMCRPKCKIGRNMSAFGCVVGCNDFREGPPGRRLLLILFPSLCSIFSAHYFLNATDFATFQADLNPVRMSL